MKNLNNRDLEKNNDQLISRVKLEMRIGVISALRSSRFIKRHGILNLKYTNFFFI